MLDVDDYNDLDDKSGLTALSKLPPTFEEKTPHDGTHRLYIVPPTDDGRFVAAVFKDEFGTRNPKPSWGEVRVANQYVVAAGSQLDGCKKDHCDECETSEGGKYTINADREIAEVSAETFVDVLRRDPKLGENEENDEGAGDTSRVDVEDVNDILDYALNESNDEKLKRLWKGDYSDYSGDRSEAESALAYKLAFWLQGDKEAVRQAMESASPEKWEERDDASYRDSILTAVDKCSEYYEQSRVSSQEQAPTYGENKEERGERLLPLSVRERTPQGRWNTRTGSTDIGTRSETGTARSSKRRSMQLRTSRLKRSSAWIRTRVIC